MIKRDRDTGADSVELPQPCHYLFDVVSRKQSVGYTSAYSLQAESTDSIPADATNIRPVREGEVVNTTYNLSDPNRPKPVHVIHSHEHEEKDRKAFGFTWGGTREEPLPPSEATAYIATHPIIFD